MLEHANEFAPDRHKPGVYLCGRGILSAQADKRRSLRRAISIAQKETKMNLTANHLRFTLEVETPIELDHHQGSALRGMLFNALRGPKNNPALGFCNQRHLTTCVECPLVAVCPVAGLVATMNPQADRGRDVARPYAIVPPSSGKTRYETGEQLSFGLTLFGNALDLFPYVVMALRQAGSMGLGKRLPRPETNGRYHRGRFAVQSAQAINLLTGEVQDILEPDKPMVQHPDLPVTHAQMIELSRRLLKPVLAHAANGHHAVSTYQRGVQAGPVEITVQFKTPTRLVNHKQLLKEPHFSPLFHRLLDRLIGLSQEYGPDRSGGQPEALDKEPLLGLSDQVELVSHDTRWQEVWSYSARQQKKTPISGLVGRATYRASREVWTELLPYVLWGTVIHVGKNAVKGDGIIAVSG